MGLTVAVIPALNEAASISAVVTDALRFVERAVVIDDGSTDATAALAAAAGAHVIRHARNLGVGAAVATGLAHAREIEATAAVQLDGDGQHDASSVPALLERLAEGADLAIGTRFEQGFEMGRVRKVVLDRFAWAISRRLQQPISDPTSGCRAFNTAAIDVLTPIFPIKYLSDTVEVLYLAAEAGLKIATVPVVMHQRVSGKPSAGPLRSAGYAIRMMSIVLRHLFRVHRR
jgi:glycosyltransferase involved in cell wall biosynthesis